MKEIALEIEKIAETLSSRLGDFNSFGDSYDNLFLFKTSVMTDLYQLVEKIEKLFPSENS